MAVNGVVPGSPSVKILSATFGTVDGLAVDSLGNLYVADHGNGVVHEVKATSIGVFPVTPTIVTIGTGYAKPYNVAVDSLGNLYIADGSFVWEVSATSVGVFPTTPTMTKLGSGFVEPVGVAVDSQGNVIVADNGNNSGSGDEKVSEIVATSVGVIPVSPTINLLASGFQSLLGVTVDGSGNIYVADSTAAVVDEIAATSVGVYPATPAITPLGAGLSAPQYVAAASGGKVFLGDAGLADVLVLEPGTSGFDALAVGSSKTMTLAYTVGADVTFGSVQVVTQGKTGLDFNDAGGSTCVSNPTLNAVSCQVKVDFTPKNPGLRKGAVVFTDGSGNVLATTYLNGTGTGPQVTFPSSILVPQAIVSSSQPRDAVVDAGGNIFYVDVSNATVHEAEASSSFSSSVLGGGFTFSWPTGIAVDGAGNVFVADSGGAPIIYEIVAAGVVTRQ